MNGKEEKPEKPQTATLELMAGEPEDGDWRETVARIPPIPPAKEPTTAPYSYRFLGGKKGRGHLSSVVDCQPKEYTVVLKERKDDSCEPGNGPPLKHWIKEIEFLGDVMKQLDKVRGAEKDRYKITNANKKVMQAYYVVTVERSDGAIIECDPMISNDPKA